MDADSPLLTRPRRVLLIKPSALGDVATALPVLRGLRRSFGTDLHIDWLLSRSCAALVADDPQLDGVVMFDRGALGRAWRSASGLRAARSLWRQLRGGDYDWVLDLQGLFRSGLFSRASGAAVRAGFADAREGAARFYTHTTAPPPECLHAVDRNIALARAVGIDARPEDFQLAVPEAGRAFAEAFVAEHGPDYVAIAPATRWPSKLYPTAHWRAVVAGLARRWPVVLLAGPGETHLSAPLAGGPHVIDLGGRTSIAQMVGLISGARGVISCDSAPMHIAAALGRPQLALIGPTEPARTGPYRRAEAVLAAEVPCRGCRRRQCPHTACMALIRPQTVLAAAEQLFA